MLETILEKLIRSIVEFSEDVTIRTEHFGNLEKMHVQVNDEDIARIIGKNGRTINALRTFIAALAGDRRVNIIVQK